MTDQKQLDPSIVAMVSLASGIAANHPAMGQCQLKKLREAGVPDTQIDIVIDIARHIRDEAGSMLDVNFDEAVKDSQPVLQEAIDVPADAGCGCSVTDKGQSCC